MKNTEIRQLKIARSEVCAAAAQVVAEVTGGRAGTLEWGPPPALQRLCDAIDAWLLASEGYRFSASGLQWGPGGEAESPHFKQACASRAFIVQRMVRTDVIQRSITSYGLKHQVERWCRSVDHPFHPGGGGHISNGAFIAAACLLLVPMEPKDHGHPNMCFALKLAGEEGR